MPKAPVNPFKTPLNNPPNVQTLLEIVAQLRGPEGCPWDRAQTHLSLTQYAIEETHELVDAIEGKNDQKIKDELGDVLFQVVLHAQLAQERGAFTFQDVVTNLCEKMIRRHPHVFSNETLSTAEDVVKRWEEIKKNEKSSEEALRENPLDVPVQLPALQRAYKIGKRTQKLQFDWDNAEQVWEKVEEEHQELREALDEKPLSEIEHEIGDVLFSVAQLARHLELDPEQVLRKANRRFENRFSKMKEIVQQEGLDFEKLTLAEKEASWQKAKKALAKN